MLLARLRAFIRVLDLPVLEAAAPTSYFCSADEVDVFPLMMFLMAFMP